MVSLDDIREELKKRLELDNKLHHVEVHASTVDEALADAAVQLDVRTDKLEYEVIERGSDGFLGIGKKPWKLKIYQDPETIIKKTEGAAGMDLCAAISEPITLQPLERTHDCILRN